MHTKAASRQMQRSGNCLKNSTVPRCTCPLLPEIKPVRRKFFETGPRRRHESCLKWTVIVDSKNLSFEQWLIKFLRSG
jgi:hypothetical protein